MTFDADQLAHILEAAMLVAGKPMQFGQFESLFDDETDKPTRDDIKAALEQLRESYENRGIELVEVASGFRLQAKQSMTPWLTHLYQEKSPRYSRALMETLVLIAYRQPITRGEIEDVRGVAVSTNIIKTLLEREWIRILGHRDVPGRPAILGTTRQFLDYFNLKRIDELPTLSEIKDLDQIDPELAKEVALLESEAAESAAEGDQEEAGGEEPGDNTATADDADAPGLEDELTTAPMIDLSDESRDTGDTSTADEPHDPAAESEQTAANGDEASAAGVEEPIENGTQASADAAMDSTEVDLNLGDNETAEDPHDASSAFQHNAGAGHEAAQSTDEDAAESPDADWDDDTEPDGGTRELRSLSEMGESETLH